MPPTNVVGLSAVPHSLVCSIFFFAGMREVLLHIYLSRLLNNLPHPLPPLQSTQMPLPPLSFHVQRTWSLFPTCGGLIKTSLPPKRKIPSPGPNPESAGPHSAPSWNKALVVAGLSREKKGNFPPLLFSVMQGVGRRGGGGRKRGRFAPLYMEKVYISAGKGG